MFKRQLLLLITSLFFSITSMGQELFVKSMRLDASDLSASQHERMDLNGQACALVKVQLAADGAKFEGNVIGSADYKTDEYWVYMTEGSRELRIKAPGYISLHVVFAAHGIHKLKAKTTYNLMVQPANAKDAPQQQKLSIHYTPNEAIVLIDSKPYRGHDGVVTAMLPVGQHDYVIACEGYTSSDGSINLKASSPSNLTVNLERIMPNDIRQTFTVGGISFTMVGVAGGTFTMGAVDDRDGEAEDREKPAHEVTLSDFSIGETEVTQALWQAVMGTNPSKHKGDNHPVEQVSWEDCQKFIKKLNKKTGQQFRLPTEAEWEYAARGGNKSSGSMYSGSSSIDAVAWYNNNGNWQTHDVKTKMPNELGLYDMSGNVWEWCQDWSDAYSSDAQTNPKGPSSGNRRVNRGGCYSLSEEYHRISHRSYTAPSDQSSVLGLRLAQ